MKTLILFLLLPFAVITQNIQWQWAKNVTNTVSNTGQERNILCAGDNGEFYLVNKSSINRIIKFDGAGNELWRINMNPNMEINGITKANGGFYVIGSYSTTAVLGASTLTSLGMNDIFICKYSSNGNALGAKSFGGNGEDKGNGICVDQAGSIYITGKFSNNVNFDSFQATDSCDYQIFVAKLDSNINTQYLKSGSCMWSTSSHSEGLKLAIDNNANLYVVGEYSYFKLDTNHVSGGGGNYPTYFLSKFNSNGTVMWVKKNVLQQTISEFRQLAVDSLNNAILHGYYHWTVGGQTKTEKYDSNGQLIWTTQISGTGNCAGGSWSEGIHVSGVNSFVIGGAGGSYNCPQTNRFVIVKYNQSGLEQYKDTTTVNATSDHDIIKDSNGDYVVCARLSGTMTLANQIISPNIFIAKFKELNTITSLLKNSFNNDLKTYPNPTAGIFKIDGLIEGSIIKIYDALGKKLKTMTTNRENLSIDLSNHPKGIYFVEVNLNGQRQTKRISYQ